MKIALKKGDLVHVSERGHRGFLYPTSDTESILHDIDADRLSWTGSNCHLPVSIPE